RNVVVVQQRNQNHHDEDQTLHPERDHDRPRIGFPLEHALFKHNLHLAWARGLAPLQPENKSLSLSQQHHALRAASRPCHQSRIGLAMKIDEYVPTMTPTTRANEKPRRTSPPKINRHNTAANVSPEVNT